MPSPLDAQLREIAARVTGPGSAYEVAPIARGGLSLPGFVHAPETLPALFDRYCTQYCDAEFLVDGDLRLTFGAVHALAGRVAAALIADHGLRPGDRVGIAAHNSANWIIAYMGVLMAGGCATLINGWWTADEIAGGAALAECSLMLCDPERAERIAGRSIAARTVVFDHGDPATGLRAVLADGPAQLPAVTGDDFATIVFTSGSTGIAKGAVSDHFALAQAAMGFAAFTMVGSTVLVRRMPGEQRERRIAALLNMPLFHVVGEVAMLLQSFVLGRKLVLMPRWDAIEAMRLIERERISAFLGVPTMVLEMASHPDRTRYDLSSCGILASGGAPAPIELAALVCDSAPGMLAMQGYALTETNSVGCSNFAENYHAKPGSVGPCGGPTVEVAIIAPDGSTLPQGMRGEVAIRSISNFCGYWRNPEETAAVLRPDGFFLTGDLGYLDEDDYLFVVDRKKDLIIRGGENISPVEVEQRLYAHPAIAEASVFGLPDARYGEVPVAVIAARGGDPPGEDELRAHVAAAIAAFKVPVRVWREEHSLPRLGSGKIDKQALKARYSQDWEAAKAAS